MVETMVIMVKIMVKMVNNGIMARNLPKHGWQDFL